MSDPMDEIQKANEVFQSLLGFEVHVSEFLTGCKRGVLSGTQLAVSPAFYSLLKSAKTQKEMIALLSSLEVVNLPPVGFLRTPQNPLPNEPFMPR